MKVLIDSSVWISYFRGTGDHRETDWLIEEGLIVTNDLVLAELAPALLVRGEKKLLNTLRAIERIPLTLDWGALIDMQVACIKNGINKVGIPDLIIAQHSIQNHLALFTLDKHFTMLGNLIALTLHEK